MNKDWLNIKEYVNEHWTEEDEKKFRKWNFRMTVCELERMIIFPKRK